MNITSIQEPDSLHTQISDLRNIIRAQVALAKTQARTWTPRPCPPKQITPTAHPASAD